MNSTFTRRITWQSFLAIFILLSFAGNAMSQNAITFSVTSGGTPVKGIYVDVEGIAVKTNSAGEAKIFLPDGDYSYTVYTSGSDESIFVGSDTFTYLDDGGSDNENRYNNVFQTPTNITVSGVATESIALTGTTFNTTVEGTAASASFNVLADYHNRNGSLKTKTVISVTSHTGGTITVPLPTARDDRQENILDFEAFYTSDIYGGNITAFDPLVSPVSIAVAPDHVLDFTITADGEAVEGIYVTTGGKTAMTDQLGQVSFDLPDGTYDYSVFSSGDPESFIIGSTTYTYRDMGEREDREDSYENIFVANAPAVVSGATSINVTLDFTTFKTTDQGTDASMDFEIIGEYSGSKDKTIAELTSNASGDIALPLPTHRSTRRGDTLEFTSFEYSALAGFVTASFVPASGVVNIDLPATYELSFDVQAGGTAVEGITIGLEETTMETDASGQASISLPAGDYSYMVYTSQTPEILTIGTDKFTYNDRGERGSTDRYDNVFVNATPITVSAAATVDIALGTTTFNTSVEGSAASAEFNIIAEYMNRNGSLQEKTMMTLSSDESGSVTLPLPTHRDDRQGNILSFDSYYTATIYSQNQTAFDPLVSPVNVSIPALSQLDFTITAGGTAVQGINVGVGDKTVKTNAQGQASVDLPDGTYYYSVFSGGDPESFIVGTQTYTYEDMGGRDDREDRYDNIFVANQPVLVSGASSETVDLSFTSFKTSVNGVEASASFDVIAEYSGDKIKTIAKLISTASGDVSLPLPTHRNDRTNDTLAFSYYQFSALDGLVNDTFELDDDPVLVEFPELFETTISIMAGDKAVEGITIEINDDSYLTDASGQVVLQLPSGEFAYAVYTRGTPESITIDGNTISYNDEGGSGRLDSYDNIFLKRDTITVSGVSTELVALTTTTFETTIGGTAAAVEFEISAAYINDDDEVKRKTITTVKSDASGAISLPLPTHRDDRQGDTLEFYSFAYADLTLSTQGLFDPAMSPVQITVPNQHNLTFTITAGSTPVEGIAVGVHNLIATTDATGQVVLPLPEGEYDILVFTEGFNEMLTIGGTSFNYLDMGGSDIENRYDNIFHMASIQVTGAAAVDISLLTPIFNTTIGGVAAAADFAIIGDYIKDSGNKQSKTIVQARSNASGTISFPLPTHRTSREGPILEFMDYSYADLLGLVSANFDPNDSPVLIALPAANEVEFVVSSGGVGVEGISIRIEELTAVTDASGELTLSLPDGTWDYVVYTAGKDEKIMLSGSTFAYMDDGGNEDEWIEYIGFAPNAYDNVFDMGSIDISDASTQNIDIGSTTFETTVNGSSAPVSLMISGDYYNDEGDLKTKKISAFSTGADGTVSLPVPGYRDSREGNILRFISYHYADISDQETGIFDPEDSPVQIAFGSLNEVVFSIVNSATSEAVEGAIVQVNGISLEASDALGETSTALAPGSYHYTVAKQGYLSIESTAFTSSEASMTINVSLEATVGIQEQGANGFSFYPNPASEVITIQFAEPYSGSIELYSIMGSLVKQIKFENELRGTIHVSDMDSGMYILRAGANSERLIIK